MNARRAPVSFWGQLKWSLVMLGATLAIAAISIPVLRWFGVEW